MNDDDRGGIFKMQTAPRRDLGVVVMKIKLPDGTESTLDDGASALDLAQSIGPRLALAALAARVNGELVDVTKPLSDGDQVEIVTFSDPVGREVYRHTTSHVMAMAVKLLFLDAKPTIGPALEDSFYYDFDVPEPFAPEDLDRIEAEMESIIKEDHPISRRDLSLSEAIEVFGERDNPYKVELIEDLSAGEDPPEKVSLYSQGEFEDLCRGPHLPSTGRIKSIKLLSSSGSYWRGDENRQRLQRVYGTSFPSKKELKDHLELLEEAKRRDHRSLGKRLDLYSIHSEVGAGLVHWHPKGAILRRVIESFWLDEHLARGYEQVYTPHIASEEIYKISGHLEKYDAMYASMEVDNSPYRVKPMNCPNHIMIYNTQVRSWRDLPIRYCELGTVYRYERSGVLHGMLRVRGFTQDDAHIFCRPDQLKDELVDTLGLVKVMMDTFGLGIEVFLSTRPEQSIGSDEVWEQSTDALKQALARAGVDYVLDPGEGVFYGPKIDIKLLDALGRPWQGPTIQVDFNLAPRFGVNFVDSDNTSHEVVMVHRAVLGSVERFVGVLIEHFAGAFPLWLSPVQVAILPITDDQHDYASQFADRLRSRGIRVHLDARSEKIGAKIREAELQRTPYMLVLGRNEQEDGSASVRVRDKGDAGAMSLDTFVQHVEEEITARELQLSL